MIQFNIKRFGKLAVWSLTNDRSFYTKQALTMLTVLTLLFVCVTTHFFQTRSIGAYEASDTRAYQTCIIATLAAFLITIVTGPSWMFSSMKGKHDLQTLLMLPASNFEKFLMRYALVAPLLGGLLLCRSDAVSGECAVGQRLRNVCDKKSVRRLYGKYQFAKPHVGSCFYNRTLASLVVCTWRHLLPLAQVCLDINHDSAHRAYRHPDVDIYLFRLSGDEERRYNDGLCYHGFHQSGLGNAELLVVLQNLLSHEEYRSFCEHMI